jgi:hypothetical protein
LKSIRCILHQKVPEGTLQGPQEDMSETCRPGRCKSGKIGEGTNWVL